MAQNGHQPNKLALLTGFGIGLSWIAMALFVLVQASRGFGHQRPDYGVAWGLSGLLLLAAGAAALIGTWWHILRRPAHD